MCECVCVCVVHACVCGQNGDKIMRETIKTVAK